MRPDDDQRDPLPRGAARKHVNAMAALYRGPQKSVECPECTGTGTYSRRPSFPGGQPQQFVCRHCMGTGRVDKS